MTLFDKTVLNISGVSKESGLCTTAMTRGNIFEMTQAAEEAVLRPRDAGAFAHDFRAALAARVARLAGDEALVVHYLAGAGDQVGLADPSETGNALEQISILAFVDKVANETREIVAEDVLGLQAAGISDADIVRLCELVAFLAYQVRVIAGLRLMNGDAA